MNTPLLIRESLVRCNLHALQEALFAGCDPNQATERGQRPLETAVIFIENPTLRLKAVTSLLLAGANPNLVSRESTSSLFMALHNSDLEVMDLLLVSRADPNEMLGGWELIYDFAEFSYLTSEYKLQLPAEPTKAARATEEGWLHFLHRTAIAHHKRPPYVLDLLWRHGARSQVPVSRRALGTPEHQIELREERFWRVSDRQRASRSAA